LKISIIVAKAKNNVIGKDNQLIWKLSSDLQLFKKLTIGHHIIMGRKTYESVGRPLPNRTSIVITRNPEFKIPDGHIVVNSFEESIQICIGKNLEQVFIIGGAEIYRQALKICDELLVTEVDAAPEGDVFFPEINPENWKEISREHFYRDEKNQYDFDFVIYKKTDTWIYH
jgi:dihydrofolate reductase